MLGTRCRTYPSVDGAVLSGRKGEILWNFNRPGTFQLACLIPGHFEAGMIGTIVVVPAAPQGKKP
jgi:plastocyanin